MAASATTSSAPACRSRATSFFPAAIGSSPLPPSFAPSSGSATPNTPTLTPPTVFSSDGASAGDGGRLTASRGGTTSAAPPRTSVSASPAANGPSLTSSVARKRAAWHRSAATSWCWSPGTTARPRRAPAPDRSWRRRAPAWRSARCRPADRWCSRTARASRGSRPCRRSSDAARPRRHRAARQSATETIAAIRAAAGSRAANGARMGSTMAIPRRRWQFPGYRGRRA